MNKLDLSNRLIALGGVKRIGKTHFSLRLSNYIAQSEKVLFLSWQECKENLNFILKEMGEPIHRNLSINTSIGYFNVATFLGLIKLIRDNSYTTIFIDDIESFTHNDFSDFFSEEKDSSITALEYIVNELKVRVIFNTVINSYCKEYPSIKDFDWSRRIINNCDQVLAIYRPSFFGIIEDENGKSLQECIEIFSLKNKNHKPKRFLLDNKNLSLCEITSFKDAFIKSPNERGIKDYEQGRVTEY